MEHDVNINYMKLCSVSQSTENLEIHYLKIMCIYIYIEIIYTHLYTRSAKICLGALHFHYDQGGDLLTLHPNLQTFQGRDDAGLATADDGNIQRILFFREDI